MKTINNSKWMVVSDCKSSQNLKAIHNTFLFLILPSEVVSDCKSSQNLKAIHNYLMYLNKAAIVVSDCKSSQNLKAIHNLTHCYCCRIKLLATAKVVKI